MEQPLKYSSNTDITSKVIYVLSLFEKATLDEVATEIVELDGIATEEGVADVTIEIREQLNRLHHDGEIKMVTEDDKKTRYSLKES